MRFFSKNDEKDIGFVINTDDTIKISGNQNLAPHAITANEVSDERVYDNDNISNERSSALDSLKKRMNIHDETQNMIKESQEENNVVAKKSLLEKIQPYTIDEQGHDLLQTSEPLYRLESVAEILKSDSKKSIEDLSKKYDIFVDDLGKSKPKEEMEDIKSSEKEDGQTIAFKKLVIEAEKREEEQLYQNLFE